MPRGVEATGVDLRPRVIAANDFIKEYLPSGIEFIDLWPLFVAPDGLSLDNQYVMADEPILKLHLNENGYRNWITVLLPTLQRLVNEN